MRQAIGDVLPLAIAAAISPFPIIGVVLMLVTPRARVNGPMFVVGWLFGLAVVGAIGLLLRIVLGGVLVILAVEWFVVAVGLVPLIWHC